MDNDTFQYMTLSLLGIVASNTSRGGAKFLFFLLAVVTGFMAFS